MSHRISEYILCATRPSGGMSPFEMLKRYSFGFYEVVFELGRLQRYARILSSGSPRELGEQDEFHKFLTKMRQECDTLDLAHTSELVAFVASQFSKAVGYTYKDQLQHLDTLSFSFSAELRKELVFRIADERREYFEKDDLLGPQVNAAFPSCMTNIKNAGNCYALEQNDACVFHCMRVLELALRVLAKELGVTFSGTLDLQNWQNIIENVESEIKNLEKLPKGKYKSETLKLFSAAAMQFRWFKEAWRNHVMHGRDVYDEGKAHSILDHVKEFMQALAEGGLTE